MPVLWMLILCVPMMLCGVGVEPHHTTAFIAPVGSVDALGTFSAYSTDHFWNKHGKKQPTYNHFKQQSYLLYVEYAIQPCDSLSLNGGFTQVQESLHGHQRGIEDIQIGWKHQFSGSDTSALTGKLTGIVPVGDKKCAVRYGKAGLQLALLYSQLFWLQQYCGWCDFDLGYRWYQGFPSDQIRADLALGVVVHPGIWLVASSQLDYGLFNGQSRGNINNIVLNSNYRRLQGKLECVFNLLTHLSVSLGGYVHFWGQNVGSGGGYFCGAWLDF